MRVRVLSFVLVLSVAGLSGCSGSDSLSAEDEFAFRRLRQEFHVAITTGDTALMRDLWADDARLTTEDGTTYVGGDAITAFLAANPNFGEALVITMESSWQAAMRGDIADYGFESIAVHLGGNPANTGLATGGAQNPSVEIVDHSHSTGMAARVETGRWVFTELNGASGPLPVAQPSGGGAVTVQDVPEDFDLPLGDELAFRRMRERFHKSTTTGDVELLRSVWAEDAVFTGGGNTYVGREAIVEFMSGSATFGKLLIVTPESSSRISINGNVAQFAYECIWIDPSAGGADPREVDLCLPNGSQNPDVEIINHTHTMGFAIRVDGQWLLQEFNGGPGPLPPLP